MAAPPSFGLANVQGGGLRLDQRQLGGKLELNHQTNAAVYLEEDGSLLFAEQCLKLRERFWC